MLLAGHYKDGEGKEQVEVLDAGDLEPGTRLLLEGAGAEGEKTAEITGDQFFSVEIKANDGVVMVGGKKLLAGGKEIKTTKALNSQIC